MLQTHINPADIDLQQALKRLELQVARPRSPADRAGSAAAGRPKRRGLGGRPPDQLAVRRPPTPPQPPPRRSDPGRPERGVPHRGDPGAHGRDARPQQPARHRPERMADRRRAAATTSVRGWRRPTAAPGRVVIRVQRRRPGGFPRRPGIARRSRSSESRCGCSRLRVFANGIQLRYADARPAQGLPRGSALRDVGRLRARRRSHEGPPDSRRLDRLVRRRHRQRPEQAGARHLVQAEERLRPEARRSPGQRRSSGASTNPAEWGSGFLTVVGSAGLAPGADDRDRCTSSRNLGYTGIGSDAAGDAAELAVRRREGRVLREIRVVAVGATGRVSRYPHADLATDAGGRPGTRLSRPPSRARSTRPPSSSRTSSASAFSSRPVSSRTLAAERRRDAGRVGARRRARVRRRAGVRRAGGAAPEAGGEYVYLREAFGGLAAFLTGWTSFVAGFSGAIAAGARRRSPAISTGSLPGAGDRAPLRHVAPRPARRHRVVRSARRDRGHRRPRARADARRRSRPRRCRTR